LQRHSVAGHDRPLRDVKNAQDAVGFVFRFRYWFRYHDEAISRGIDDPRWIPAGFERIAVEHGAQEAYRVLRWRIYAYPTGGVVHQFEHMFTGGHTIGQCMVIED